MPVAVTHSEILKQSEQVFNQFGESKWIPNCDANAKLAALDSSVLRNSGVGKTLVLVAMGASLEEHVETLKKYRDRIDIVTNDKCFGPLLERGIKANFVMLCDASIPFHHVEKYIDQTADVALISTCYGNTDWTHAWKGPKFFYINRDSIVSERIFLPRMPAGTRTIPAGSNVSNAMVVFFTGSDNQQNVNWSGYERFLLVGYDYSWRPDGNYYAWANPVPKRHYMNHRTILDMNNDVAFTSENLFFSAKWLYSYVTSFGLPVVNCSGRGLLIVNQGKLEPELERINPDPTVRAWAREIFSAGRQAHTAAEQMRRLFEQAREGLYVRR